MNAPRREIPIIDLFTGLPWVPEPESESTPETLPAQPADAAVPGEKPRPSVSSGPPIAAHRQMDATAIDVADAREEQRKRCRGCLRHLGRSNRAGKPN